MMFGFKNKKDDPLYNRRRFMVLMTIYAVVWGFTILICDIRYEFETPKVLAYLGFISTLSGAGLFAYFKQAAKDDPSDRQEDR